jgi:DNA ligase D
MARTAAPAVELDVAGRTVRVTSPDRVVFPARGITKLQVVEYFVAVSDGILGALLERPTTLERWPKGVFEGAVMATRADSRGDAFYQKRVPQGAPDYVETARIAFPSGRTADEVCPTEPAVVAWAANLGTLTFHPWPVRRGPEPDSTERVDQLRIDLDPQPGTAYADAAAVAPHLRELLGELGLTGYPKTSGGRGVHVFVPLAPRWSFQQARRATIAIGRELERRLPDQVTTRWWKEERGAKIFVDYNQMARDRTIASAYSVRANPRATVSTPLEWDEVAQVQPDDFDVLSVPARLAERGDLFAPLRADRDPALDCDLEPALELARRDEEEHGLGDLPYPPEYPKMPGEPKRVQPSRDRDRARTPRAGEGHSGAAQDRA